MRAEWAGRWVGAACAVAGCTPMLFAAVAGTAGSVGAQGVRLVMGGMAGGMRPMVPGWVVWLGAASWPLLLLSTGLLLWSLWRAPGMGRLLAYGGVALLLINQFHMRLWLFIPALLLLFGGFAASFLLSGRSARTRPAR